MLAPAVCHYTELAGDASFRRYFRVTCDDGRRFVLMDSPPDKEDPAPFAEITRRLLDAEVTVPRIHYQDLSQGLLLLDDLGDALYLDRLNHDTADALYRDAINALVKIQQADTHSLPAFDEPLLLEEMHLFTDWLLKQRLGIALNTGAQQIYEEAFRRLVENAREQPQTFVHRDYHSRNLLLIPHGNSPGILDHQDAVLGPLSYDLVSLLKDCYIRWGEADVARWRDYYLERSRANGGADIDEAHFVRWFDLMGMQRHFKAAGIFARLYCRDGKRGYLADIPRTVDYIADCAASYDEFGDLKEELDQLIPQLSTELPQ